MCAADSRRPRRQGRDGRHSFVVALALLAVGILIAPGAAPARAASAQPSHILPHPDPRASFAAAVQSLRTGAGPAAGTPLACTLKSELSADCGAFARGSHGVSSVAGFGSSGLLPRKASPGGLTGAAMAYDAAPGVQAVILFGGIRPNGQISGDTWSFLQGDWYNVTSLVKGPSPRWGAAMTYDAADGYLFMYGGCRDSPTESGICPFAWAEGWGLSSSTWALVSLGFSTPPPPVGPPPPPSAPPSYDAAMAYDVADGYVVLFGGAEGVLNQPPPTGGGLPPPLPDILPIGSTYTYSGGLWTQLSPSSAPSPRYGAAFAYDPAIGEAVLFGGTNRTAFSPAPADYGDTWTFAGGSWSNISSRSGPGALWGASLSYDGASQKLVLYGGALPAGIPNGSTWSYAPTGWNLENLSNWMGTGIAPRWGAAMTSDRLDDYVLLVGGSSASGAGLSDVWSWVLGTAGNSYWQELSAGTPAPTAPSPRWDPGWTWMSTGTTGFGLLFGGERCTAAACAALGDTWRYSGGSWHATAPKVAPPARYGASMAFDPADGYTVLFGGCGPVCPLGDTWVYTSKGVWKQLLELVTPSPRFYASLTFDLFDNELILFGGCGGGQGPCPLGDTWSFVHGLWTNLTGTLSLPEPVPRFAAAALGSSAFAMMYGGMGATGALSDLWWFYNGTWRLMPTPQGVPPFPAAFASLGYDPVDKELLLFGGCSTACPIGYFAFSYHFNGTMPVYPPPPPPPPGPGGPPPIPPPVGWAIVPPLPNPELPPPPEYGAPPIWDARDGIIGYLLFFGGRVTTGVTIQSSEIFVGSSWVDVSSWV